MSDFDKAKQDPAGKKQRMAAADGKVYFRYATISNTMSRACALKQTQNENPNGFIIILKYLMIIFRSYDIYESYLS